MGALKRSLEGSKNGTSPRIAPVEAVAIAEEVASSLRHDLRNKFAAIRNAVFYIERSLTKSQTIEHDPRIGRFLRLVCEQLDDADTLLDQRGKNDDIVRSTRAPTRIGACIEAALSRRVVPDGVAVVTVLTDRGEVCVDAEEVTLAIDCLLDNAFEAVGGSGEVTVRTEDDPDAIRVRVDDTGPGMSPEQRAQALVPFSSEKPGHLGLGINIAGRIAGRMGGKLELAERDGPRGTAWILTVPKPS